MNELAIDAVATPADARAAAVEHVSLADYASGLRAGIYTAEATVTGGRTDGHGATSDGALDVQLRTPQEMGGPGGGTNPEQLFAVGYASCFESALGVVRGAAGWRRVTSRSIRR